MSIYHRLLVFSLLFLLAADRDIRADDAAELLEVSIEVTSNFVEGSSVTGCTAATTVETTRQLWWIAIAQVQPSDAEGWQATDRIVACGVGSYGGGSPDTGPVAGTPYLIAAVSTSAALNPASLTPERLLVLGVSLSLQKLSGLGVQGEPVYKKSEESRKFYFSEGGEAVLPLLVADEAEEKAFGFREIFLRVAAGRVSDGAPARYGVVQVMSGASGGELVLDGGVTGTIAPNTLAELRNIPPGLRVVAFRDATGRETRKWVRVESDRTALVDFSVPGSEAAHYRLEALGKNEQGYEEYRRGSDGAVVVAIPAGEFLMGNKDTEGAPLEHEVYVSDFLIDKLGVTWGQYKKHVEATGIAMPPRDPYWGIHDNHPAVFVTWEEAKAYCEWAGGRLPTEAEREKASRGTDRRKYPWGNEEPAPHLGVFRSSWGFEATAPVGTHPAGVSPYGVLDMGGNVWEWCSDWWDRDYFAVSPYRDPQGPASGNAHVLKGGSWDSRPSVLSSSARNFGHLGYRELDFGFRCAMNSPE